MKEKCVNKVAIAKETKTKAETEKIQKMKKEFQDAIYREDG